MPSSVDFGTLNPGQSSTRTITLVSNGTIPVSIASALIKCNLGTLAPGASVSLVLYVTVTTKKTSVTNGASATSTAPDPDPSDNQASVTTPVK